MGDYTGMSAYYDLIMTSGYYDYEAIAGALARQDGVRTVLEIGAGTGLIIDRLVAHRPDLAVVGIDLTRAMLDIAATRLAPHPQVTLRRQDVVTLDLGQRFDLAFSYGGVWYFVPDGDGSFALVSHIRDRQANLDGLLAVADHVHPGGSLLLGVQGPHADYEAPVSGGLLYAQRITPLDEGFRKDYRLTAPSQDGDPQDGDPQDGDPQDGGTVLMTQTTDYRTYPFDEAIELLDKAGFDLRRVDAAALPGFLEFTRR